jgi:hypothetical protein
MSCIALIVNMYNTNDKIDRALLERMAQTAALQLECQSSRMSGNESTDSRGELAEIGHSGTR